MMVSLMSRVEDFSLLVSETLDNMGYCHSLVRERQHYWKNFADEVEKSETDMLVCGSKGDGLISSFENDMDVMGVVKDAICIEGTRQCTDMRDLTMFQLDMEDTSPGFARLRLLQVGRPNEAILSSLIKADTRHFYLSSDMICNRTRHSSTGITELFRRAGPSKSLHFQDFIQSNVVFALPCKSPSILSPWLTRKRRHDWPDQAMIDKISNMDAYVVPVGFKDSGRRTEEWRISYTMAELELVQNFTNTQTKVYILLKYLAKDVLQKECDVVTSYVMKNVVLWVSELTPHALSVEKLLIDVLVTSLKLLQMFTKTCFCPSYMIAKRNLFSGKLSVSSRRKMLSKTEELIDEGGSMLLRCERLRIGLIKMYDTPEDMIRASERQAFLENVFLSRGNEEKWDSKQTWSAQSCDTGAPVYILF